MSKRKPEECMGRAPKQMKMSDFWSRAEPDPVTAAKEVVTTLADKGASVVDVEMPGVRIHAEFPPQRAQPVVGVAASVVAEAETRDAGEEEDEDYDYKNEEEYYCEDDGDQDAEQDGEEVEATDAEKQVAQPPADPLETPEALAFFAFKQNLIPPGQKKKPNPKPGELAVRREARDAAIDKENALSARTRWDNRWTNYNTGVQLGGKMYHILTHNMDDALEADRLANVAADAANSWKTQRALRAAKKASLVDKRARDVAVHGNNGGMERRLLFRDKATAKEAGLEFHIMPDGCKADALFRNNDLPPGYWLQLQKKTTSNMKTRYNKRQDTWHHLWQFYKVKGYGGMLVACECEEDGNVWILEGDALNKGKSSCLSITKSKQTGKALPAPCDMNCFQVDRDALVDRMIGECNLVEWEDPDALPLVTIYEAEAHVGKTHAVERKGVLAYIQHVLGGSLPIVDAYGDELVHRRTHSGALFKYPDEQNGKVDLYVKKPGDEDWRKIQFKTPIYLKQQTGFGVYLQISDGTDTKGKRISRNVYKSGDNDEYVFVLHAGAAGGQACRDEVHIWTIPDAVMAEHRLLGEDALCGLKVYMPDHLAKDRGGVAYPRAYGWTKAHHKMYKVAKTD